jgi:hypothetical protein
MNADNKRVTNPPQAASLHHMHGLGCARVFDVVKWRLMMAGIAFSQSPAFEVASIHMYADGAPFPTGGATGITVSPDGVAWRYARLSFCIGWAYDIPGRISGPNWIHDRYDIVAKASGPVSKEKLRLMVRTLLEERFKLKVHRETVDVAVVALIVAKNGPKNLQKSTDGDPPKYEVANGTLSFQIACKFRKHSWEQSSVWGEGAGGGSNRDRRTFWFDAECGRFRR